MAGHLDLIAVQRNSQLQIAFERIADLDLLQRRPH